MQELFDQTGTREKDPFSEFPEELQTGKENGREGIARRLPLVILMGVICLATIAGILLGSGGIRKNALGLVNLQPKWKYLSSSGSMKSYTDSGRRISSRLGIDVSVHQGEINWKKVKAEGVQFAMVRLGFRGYKNGKLVLDKNFRENVKRARAAGLDVGVYFFSQAVNEKEAEKEAAFTIKNLKGLDITYPVVFDEEELAEAKARTDNLTGKQVTSNCVSFCKAIEKAGYLPMVYMNNTWAAQMYDSEALKSYLVWYADYRKKPKLNGEFAMWQYTNQGTLKGIDSQYVDMDLLFIPEKN